MKIPIYYISLLTLLLFLYGCNYDAAIKQPVSQDATPTNPVEASATQTFAPSGKPSIHPTQTPQTATAVPQLIDFDEALRVGEVAYVFPLTIRHVTEARAVLFFELASPTDGLLFYEVVSNENGETFSVPISSEETRHLVNIEGLTAGTTYRVRIVLEGKDGIYEQPAFNGESWGDVEFRTMSENAQLRFGVFGDASFGDQATADLVKEMTQHDLDFVIHTGDVVVEIAENPSPQEAYALKFFQTLSPLLHKMPVYTVIGNHDHDPAARWEDSFYYYYAFPPFQDSKINNSLVPGGNQFYAFAQQDVQFLMLDSQVWFRETDRDAQNDFIRERLADTRFRFTIPVFHVPPFFSGSAHPEDQLPIRQHWHPIFEEAGAPLVFSGHSHHYERLEADGITYIVSGGGSAVLYAAGDFLEESQVYGRRTHFVLLDIYPDRIDLQAIDRFGDVFDSLSLSMP